MLLEVPEKVREFDAGWKVAALNSAGYRVPAPALNRELVRRSP